MRRLLAAFVIVGIAILLWSVPVPYQSGSSVPSGSEARRHGKHEVKLNWKPPVGPRAEQPRSYLIYRTEASIKDRVVNCGKKWRQIATTAADVTRYTDAEVTPGKKYCYAVSAMTSRGESSKSFFASAAIPSP